jgi:hypothetical protein
MYGLDKNSYHSNVKMACQDIVVYYRQHGNIYGRDYYDALLKYINNESDSDNLIRMLSTLKGWKHEEHIRTT